MPEMRGDKLINQIQFMDSSCKFIVMTGYSVEDEVQQILAEIPRCLV